MNADELNLAKKLYGVFETLRDLPAGRQGNENFSDSGTHKLLQEKDAAFFSERAKEEFKELEGCIDGSHRHSDDFEKDFLLESSQVFYWLALASIVQQKSFKDFLTESSSDLEKLEKLHTENNISIQEIFEKDLKECREKGYIKD